MRREATLISLALLAIAVFAGTIFTAEKFNIEHPIKNPPKYTDKERCDNCGMDRNKWARTRYEFETSKGKFHTCSIHCVAVMKMKLADTPKSVKAAEYLNPEKMFDADTAFYVIGSTAPGTMTAKSKIAFPSKEEAEKFSAKYGGTVGSFSDALSEAEKDVHGHRHHEHKH
ncbi:MAG: nitrous oxide reductase accessory protein NosL [Nitrospirae bacterium]|nr:nitrous oxide reductase accessory protein NosL [Nitrospirota bacterium]